MHATAADIDALLPQTQCTRCGFEGCAPYAAAIARTAAPINRCPPGGTATIAALAALTGLASAPLDASCGVEGPLAVALIDETRCIGCTLCIAACPVDAIIGGAKRMHAVLPSLCSGCELCVAPCPVDCITLVPAARAWTAADATAARARHSARAQRLVRSKAAGVARKQAPAARADALEDSRRAVRQAAVAAALERARARRNTGPV
jgi:Na+-translocating ferredoxin:NAD+ oxidoreductase subunit B